MIYCADLMLVRYDDKVLLLKRTEDDDLFPGKLCFQGGHKKDKESFESCARRECKEETGLEPIDVEYLGGYLFAEDVYTKFFVASSYVGRSFKLSKEHESAGWYR